MPFVHSLVRSLIPAKKGWCAPVELGEAAPHYLSFVVPVDAAGQFFEAYSCEMVSTPNKGASKAFLQKRKTIATHELLRKGKDAFSLRVNEKDFWFFVKPTVKSERRLPYVGRLKHADFQYLFTEIEPEDLAALDDLCTKDHVFVVGCDPFTHYLGIKKHA